MTREHKLALILGFSIVLVVGVLVSDHLSGASLATIQSMEEPIAEHRSPALLAPGQALHEDGQEQPPAMAGTPSENQAGQSTEPASGQSAPMRTLAANGLESLIDAVRSQVVPADRGAPPVASQLRTETPPSEQPDGSSVTEIAMPPSTRHVIRESETLWSIAEEHYGDGSAHQKIAIFNETRISNPSALRVGTTIYLPEKTWLLATSAAVIRDAGARPFVPEIASASTPTQAGANTAARTYTVEKGDTLGEISMKLLGTSKRWREIVSLNEDRISNPDRVPAGVVLRIPGD